MWSSATWRFCTTACFALKRSISCPNRSPRLAPTAPDTSGASCLPTLADHFAAPSLGFRCSLPASARFLLFIIKALKYLKLNGHMEVVVTAVQLVRSRARLLYGRFADRSSHHVLRANVSSWVSPSCSSPSCLVSPLPPTTSTGPNCMITMTHSAAPKACSSFFVGALTMRLWSVRTRYLHHWYGSPLATPRPSVPDPCA